MKREAPLKRKGLVKKASDEKEAVKKTPNEKRGNLKM
jgi:hypothetical protein